MAAAQAIGTAPGVSYSLSIASDFGDAGGGIGGIDSEGHIDFEGRRFSGTADGGAAGGTMLMFGGPTHGALIIANGSFVKTEAGPWERQPDQATMLDPFLDRAGLSRAIAAAFAVSRIDPEIRAAPCGAETCRVVGLVLPPAALAGLSTFAFGDRASELPPDLAATEVDLSLDSSGFPVRMEARIKAGTTVTTVRLQLARLDPPPVIALPIP
jgi:hypothetical protein